MTAPVCTGRSPVVPLAGRLDAMNGVTAGLLGTNAAQLAASAATVAQQTAQLPPALIDVLEVPGKGKCQVHVAR